MVEPLLDVRQKDQAAVGVHGRDEAGQGGVHPVHHRLHRVDQEPPNLGARQEQHAVTQTAPAFGHEVARGPIVIAQQDRVDPGALRLGEDLDPVPPGVRRVLGVRVQDGAVVVQARRRIERPPRRGDPGDGLARGLQSTTIKTLRRRDSRRLIGLLRLVRPRHTTRRGQHESQQRPRAHRPQPASGDEHRDPRR